MSVPPDVEGRILDEARTEVAYADHKASMVLAALGIAFGALLGGLLAGDWKPSDLHGLAELVWWLGAVAAVLSVSCAAGAVWPRYRKPKNVTSVHYWGDVASFRSPEALSAHLDNHPVMNSERTRHQMWELARIVSKKYFLIRASFVCAGLAAVGFVGAALASLN